MTILDEDDAKQLFAKVAELTNRLEAVEEAIKMLRVGFTGIAKRLLKR